MTLRRRGYLAEAMQDGTMVGSSGTLDGIRKLIGDFYAGERITLKPTGDNEWSVANSKRVIDTVRVIKKGRRFRFEAGKPLGKKKKPVTFERRMEKAFKRAKVWGYEDMPADPGKWKGSDRAEFKRLMKITKWPRGRNVASKILEFENEYPKGSKERKKIDAWIVFLDEVVTELGGKLS
jgi:hypothetical protein